MTDPLDDEALGAAYERGQEAAASAAPTDAPRRILALHAAGLRAVAEAVAKAHALDVTADVAVENRWLKDERDAAVAKAEAAERAKVRVRVNWQDAKRRAEAAEREVERLRDALADILGAVDRDERNRIACRALAGGGKAGGG